MPKNIIIAGAPGAGKGTQCEELIKKYNYVHISTGDALRAEVEAGTELGRKCDEVMKAGKLVSDDIVIPIVRNRISKPDARERGWILDGFPRTGAQAKALTGMGVRPDVFINIDVPANILEERIIHRRCDPVTGKIYHLLYNPPPESIRDRLVHRKDDVKEQVGTRYKAFTDSIAAIRSEYKDIEVTVNGNQSKEQVWAAVQAAVDKGPGAAGATASTGAAGSPSAAATHAKAAAHDAAAAVSSAGAAVKADAKVAAAEVSKAAHDASRAAADATKAAAKTASDVGHAIAADVNKGWEHVKEHTGRDATLACNSNGCMFAGLSALAVLLLPIALGKWGPRHF